MFEQDTPQILETIVNIAKQMIVDEDKERAAYLLAFVLGHAETNPSLYDTAWDLFDDLESELCPRVIWDAREWAQQATLKNVALRLKDHV